MLKFSRKHSLICQIIGLSRVGMDSDEWVHVLLSGFGEKKTVLYFCSKIFLTRTQLKAKLQGQRRLYGKNCFLFLQQNISHKNSVAGKVTRTVSWSPGDYDVSQSSTKSTVRLKFLLKQVLTVLIFENWTFDMAGFAMQPTRPLTGASAEDWEEVVAEPARATDSESYWDAVLQSLSSLSSSGTSGGMISKCKLQYHRCDKVPLSYHNFDHSLHHHDAFIGMIS